MHFTEQLISSIQDANDILDVIGDYVSPLKKKGANFWGLCPFHSEKTPSFSVNPAKNIFKCFGCGKGGSMFNFIMEIEGVNFPDALKILAEKAHIELPNEDQKEFTGTSVEDNLYEVNRWAARIFFENLKKEEGKIAREYFSKRGILPETCVKFGLGFALSSWDDLKSHAYHDQVRMEYLEQAGLVVRKEDGSYYDRFRDRVIFPIQDAVGRVLGFTGRILNNEPNQAKYINSPESPVYHKGKVLFGLFHAKDEIRKRDEVILVEGNIDVVSLHQAEIKNVVATSGTALTTDQIKLIKRYTKRNFVFIYDGDDAGLKAMERSIELLFEEGLFPQIVRLPSEHDPDSYIQTFGRELFFEYIRNNRKSFIEFINDVESAKINQTDITAKKELVNHLLGLIVKFNEPIGREFMIKELAKFTSVTESVLTVELNKRIATSKGKNNITQKPNQAISLQEKVMTTQQRVTKISASERDVIKVVMEYGKQYLEYITFFVEPNHFQNEAAKQVYIKLIDYFRQSDKWNIAVFLQNCDENEKNLVERLSIEKYTISEKWKEMGFIKEDLDLEKWIQDIIVDLRISFITAKTEQIRLELLSMHDDEQMTLLLGIQKELQQEKKQIISRKIFDN